MDLSSGAGEVGWGLRAATAQKELLGLEVLGFGVGEEATGGGGQDRVGYRLRRGTRVSFEDDTSHFIYCLIYILLTPKAPIASVGSDGPPPTWALKAH